MAAKNELEVQENAGAKPRRARKRQPAPKHLVVLVQGTFQNDAKSGLGTRGALADKLRSRGKLGLGARYLVPKSGHYAFSWSGANKERSRIAAGRDLLRLLRRADRDPRISDVTVVGYSHGGTVIWLALQLAAQRARLRKLRRWITIGTPFFRHPALSRPLDDSNETMERNCHETYGAKWSGLIHPRDEAFGLFRWLAKGERIKVPDSLAGHSLFSSWTLYLVQKIVDRNALGGMVTPSVVASAPLTPKGRRAPKLYKMADTAVRELSRASAENVETTSVKAVAGIQEALGRGSVKIPAVSYSTMLIHCLYFENQWVQSWIRRMITAA